jgi:hypothetical protein
METITGPASDRPPMPQPPSGANGPEQYRESVLKKRRLHGLGLSHNKDEEMFHAQ